MTAKQPSKADKKPHQINVKLPDELFDRLQSSCEIQQHDYGQLARILIEWALPFYEEARSVEALHTLKLETKFSLADELKKARERVAAHEDAEIERKKKGA